MISRMRGTKGEGRSRDKYTNAEKASVVSGALILLIITIINSRI